MTDLDLAAIAAQLKDITPQDLHALGDALAEYQATQAQAVAAPVPASAPAGAVPVSAGGMDDSAPAGAGAVDVPPAPGAPYDIPRSTLGDLLDQLNLAATPGQMGTLVDWLEGHGLIVE